MILKDVNWRTYAIPQSSLEHWSVFASPALRNTSMVDSKLDQISKNRDARNLRQVLDFGEIRRIKVSDEQIDGGGDNDADELIRHGEGCDALLPTTKEQDSPGQRFLKDLDGNQIVLLRRQDLIQ